MIGPITQSTYCLFSTSAARALSIGVQRDRGDRVFRLRRILCALSHTDRTST